MPVDAKGAVARLKELRTLTADKDGAQRLAWSPLWLKAREWFQSKLHELPVEHHLDAAGNSWTTLAGVSKKNLILGSHLDSVPNGGWLDGCLGVLAAHAVLRRIAEEFAGKPPITIRLVDWADEEGARFGRSL
ncbi:MAG: M20/M25/M40 family metallo-hydrolase, partial [Terracidiphilus sp.]